MISKTIGFRGLAYFQTHPYSHMKPICNSSNLLSLTANYHRTSCRTAQSLAMQRRCPRLFRCLVGVAERPVPSSRSEKGKCHTGGCARKSFLLSWGAFSNAENATFWATSSQNISGHWIYDCSSQNTLFTVPTPLLNKVKIGDVRMILWGDAFDIV